jgi:hypothetical protein
MVGSVHCGTYLCLETRVVLSPAVSTAVDLHLYPTHDTTNRQSNCKSS